MAYSPKSSVLCLGTKNQRCRRHYHFCFLPSLPFLMTVFLLFITALFPCTAIIGQSFLKESLQRWDTADVEIKTPFAHNSKLSKVPFESLE